jgi:hypothetical protein
VGPQYCPGTFLLLLPCDHTLAQLTATVWPRFIKDVLNRSCVPLYNVSEAGSPPHPSCWAQLRVLC